MDVRTGYHHGNLRAALLEAATGLARDGGPDAVVLREVTRRAGVSPNAAYRHFTDRDALLDVVCGVGMSALGEWIVAATAAFPAPGGEKAAGGSAEGAAAAAWRRLRAVGRAYVEFALAEPGLFRTAFSVPERLPDDAERPVGQDAGAGAASPYRLLGQALDGLVEAGALPAARRPGAEIPCWAAVHGFALLVLDGPLRGLPAVDRERFLGVLLDAVERGL